MARIDSSIVFAAVFFTSMALIVAGVLCNWSWWIVGPSMMALFVNAVWGVAKTTL